MDFSHVGRPTVSLLSPEVIFSHRNALKDLQSVPFHRIKSKFYTYEKLANYNSAYVYFNMYL
jgi:hypothetical protein